VHSCCAEKPHPGKAASVMRVTVSLCGIFGDELCTERGLPIRRVEGYKRFNGRDRFTISAECCVHKRNLVKCTATHTPSVPQELHDTNIVGQGGCEILQVLICFGAVMPEAWMSWIGPDQVFSH
jgi:hypothetical protein